VKLARRRGLNPEAVTNLAVYCALSGLLGARLMMFVFDWSYYAANPGEIFSLATLQAAGVYQGGLILALIVAILYMRRQKLPVLATMDVFAPGLALGHGVGRLGCFAAGCCWGAECKRPWAVTFTDPEANRLTGVPLGTSLHPSQLYEAVAEGLIFVLLWRRIAQPHREGHIFALYLLLYSAVRFAVEFFRSHAQALPFGLPLSNTQWISLALFGVGLWLLRRSSRAAPMPK
jgi:phosphatidylglycerol:prolipoprotein diacylglycerol transferase